MKQKTIAAILMILLVVFIVRNSEAGLFTTYQNQIYYHCADWGPNEGGTDELIYFVKQIIFHKNKGSFTNVVFFCSMKPDGSDKKEITKLFEDTAFPLDLNGNTSFMDICAKTKKAAIAFSAGGEEVGLWTINLDGSDFKRIREYELTDGKNRIRINHPSWFPDGEHLVYEETWRRGFIEYYIVKIDKNGKNKMYLTTEKDGDVKNRFPAVSPDGKKIAYTHFLFEPDSKYGRKQIGRNLWVMSSDGSNKRMLYDNKRHYADYPEWSPDGKQLYVVYASDFTLVDSSSGKELISKSLQLNDEAIAYMRKKNEKRPEEERPKFYLRDYACRKMHWSDKYGYLLDGAGTIGITRKDFTYLNLDASQDFVKTKRQKDLSKYEYLWGK